MKIKLTKQIYIASPYSSRLLFPFNKLQEFYRYRVITKLIGRLHDLYPYAFIGPITQSHNTAPYTKTKNGGFEYWRRIDLTFVSKCDEVWVASMPGWDKSVGVTEEINFAITHKIPVKFIDPATLKIKRARIR